MKFSSLKCMAGDITSVFFVVVVIPSSLVCLLFLHSSVVNSELERMYLNNLNFPSISDNKSVCELRTTEAIFNTC